MGNMPTNKGKLIYINEEYLIPNSILFFKKTELIFKKKKSPKILRKY